MSPFACGVVAGFVLGVVMTIVACFAAVCWFESRDWDQWDLSLGED